MAIRDGGRPAKLRAVRVGQSALVRFSISIRNNHGGQLGRLKGIHLDKMNEKERKTSLSRSVSNTSGLSSSCSQELLSFSRECIAVLFRKGIKVLALDFDKTIIDIHTSGFWRQGTPKLVEHVRHCFRLLITAALESKMHVCVVTYSMQPGLIRDVLQLSLPKWYGL